MEASETKKQNIVRQHTTAGCLSGGWQLLADNIWTLLRASWPVLILCAVWGLAAAVLLRPGIYTFPALVALLAAGLILDLLWLAHTTVLLRRYVADGAFPPTRPLKHATTLWNNNLDSAWGAMGRAVVLILRHPRQWPPLLGIFFVGLVCKALALLLFAAPLMSASLVQLQAGAAASIGDAAQLPAYLSWLAPLADAVAVPVLFVFSWMILFPVAFFVGSLYADSQEDSNVDSSFA